MERNALGDWFGGEGDDVLVLSDEVHHAYSHLKLTGDEVAYDFKEKDLTKKSEKSGERLWMKFIREEPRIHRHIGFTGTPYNTDEYFPDVICNYSIRDAVDDKYIKRINPILKTETDEGDGELTREQRFEQIIQTHVENREKFAYKDSKGRRRVKPITIFINNTQKIAQNNADAFAQVLAGKLRVRADQSLSELEVKARGKILVVVSQLNESDYKQQLTQIEETDPEKIGGAVEYIFAVNKLSEGWDVDNVFQIVPAEERVFNSKLLISQVLGRGLRMPRTVPLGPLFQKYPTVTITNHEKFADHIKELLDEVTECELRLRSQVIMDPASERYKHHFSLFNLDYLPQIRTEPREESGEEDTPGGRELKLTPSAETLGLKVTYLQETKRFELTKQFVTVDRVVVDVARRFKMHTFESAHFDFGDGITIDGVPTDRDIEKVIRTAMEKAGFAEDKLSSDNRQQIELFFNQYLPRGKSRVVRENVEGNVTGISTEEIQASSARAGSLEQDTAAYLSEDWPNELSESNRFILKELTREGVQMELEDQWIKKTKGYDPELIKQMGSFRNLYTINPSLFRTPQELVISRHEPERQFMFQLIEKSKYLKSWIKSPDSSFYGLDYEYWKAGKDRVRRSFNPDYFLRIRITDYLLHISQDSKDQSVQRLRLFQDRGIEDLILVVEIKHDDDDSAMTSAKEQYGELHFKALNHRLRNLNPADLPAVHPEHLQQHYGFLLLRPENYNSFFGKLRSGLIAFEFGEVEEPTND